MGMEVRDGSRDEIGKRQRSIEMAATAMRDAIDAHQSRPPPQPLNKPAQVAIAALVLLGLIGGTLVVVHGGFETSPKRGGTPVFVPAPQAWLLAATMFGMSLVGWVALVREWRRSIAGTMLAVGVYGLVAVALVGWFRQG